MNYSSYLGSQKCNNVVCRQGEIGPRGLRGLIGPTGPSGNHLNSFTINSSIATYDISNDSIVWIMDIPFVYGKQFTFTFHTNNTVVDSYTPTFTTDYELFSTNNYIFGTGQAVYQPYIITTMGVTHTNNGYIIDIISQRGTKVPSNFVCQPIVDIPNNKINYKIIYYVNDINTFNAHFSNSTIQLNGTKC
jgi:hypothetical protein